MRYFFALFLAMFVTTATFAGTEISANDSEVTAGVEASYYGGRCRIATHDPYCWYEGYWTEEMVCVKRGPLGRCLLWERRPVCQWDGRPMRCS